MLCLMKRSILIAYACLFRQPAIALFGKIVMHWACFLMIDFAINLEFDFACTVLLYIACSGDCWSLFASCMISIASAFMALLNDSSENDDFSSSCSATLLGTCCSLKLSLWSALRLSLNDSFELTTIKSYINYARKTKIWIE